MVPPTAGDLGHRLVVEDPVLGYRRPMGLTAALFSGGYTFVVGVVLIAIASFSAAIFVSRRTRK